MKIKKYQLNMMGLVVVHMIVSYQIICLHYIMSIYVLQQREFIICI
jgi:hypothetical protein